MIAGMPASSECVGCPKGLVATVVFQEKEMPLYAVDHKRARRVPTEMHTNFSRRNLAKETRTEPYS